MDARAVDDAGERLHELRSEERADLGLAAVAFALALLATQVLPTLALPVFLGALYVGGLGVRAVWRHWELVNRLVGDRDAYLIPEVRSQAEGQATMRRRHDLAMMIRRTLEWWARAGTGPPPDVIAELAALASELDDDDLVLDPVSAVTCNRLLTDPVESPLRDPNLSARDLRACVRRIRLGFEPHR